MSKLIDKVNRDFRKILEGMDSPLKPVKNILIDVNQKFLDRKCTIGKDPIPTFIKPYFISAERNEYVRKVQNTFMSVIEKLVNLYYESPEWRPMFELTEEEKIWAEIDTKFKRKVWITRNDAFMSDDFLKFIEFNTDSPGGPMYSDVQTELLFETDVLKQLSKKYIFTTDRFVPQTYEALLQAYREFGGKKEKPGISIVGGVGSSTLPEFMLIVEWLKQKGHDSQFADPRWVEYDGKNVSFKGTIIDIAYRRGWIHDYTDYMEEIKPLIQAAKDGNVCIVNPPKSILGSQKCLMDIMQRENMQKYFSHEEQRVIMENLPWSRRVNEGYTAYHNEKVDLYEFIRQNKDLLILKPIDMYGGKGVYIGPAVSQAEWENCINETYKKRYLVQEYVPIPEEELPVVEPELAWKKKKINTNFFAYAGKHAGGFVRTSDDPVINISKGGGLTPIVIVHGEK